jgi:hypothetical protein
MAIPAQGLTFSWSNGFGTGGVLQEIQSVDIRPSLEFRESGGRDQRAFSYRGGEAILSGYSMENLSPRFIGFWGLLRITVPTPSGTLVLFEGGATYSGATIQSVANEVVTFAFRFTLSSVRPATGTVS